MIISVYLPLLAGCLLAWLGPRAARRLSPPAATRLLAGCAVFSAAATAGTLILLCVGGLINAFSTAPHSAGGLPVRDPVPWPTGVAAAVVLAVMAVRLVRAVRREWRMLGALRDLVSGCGEGLMVLDDPRPYAYAVPVGHGTIVVSTAMMASLSSAERRALLAHEQAHLDHGHHGYRVAVAAAVAFNPLLGGIRRELKLQIERWADESAAQQVTRPVTARSLARAALAAVTAPAATLAYANSNIRERLAALADTPAPSRWDAVVPAAVISLAAAATLLDASRACLRILELVCQ